MKESRISKIKQAFDYWNESGRDYLENVDEGDRTIVDDANDNSKHTAAKIVKRILGLRPESGLEQTELSAFGKFYNIVGVIVCLLMSGVLVYCAAYLPEFGKRDTPHNNEVADRYLEDGLEETGAVNAVAGMILDYRAFDTLGESHVLFTALMCVLILLKNTDKQQVTDDTDDSLFRLSDDVLVRKTVGVLFPFILLFGVYIMLCGHLGPGGGFSGGAVCGAGLILYSLAFGSEGVSKFFTEKTFKICTCTALCFYSLSKSYSFYTGANHLESIIPKGTPGAIISAGLILPLDIAVGIIVACTMYGFYAMFKKGRI